MSTSNSGFSIHGIATNRTLIAAGWSERSITREVRAGTMNRVRNGWYALPSASSVDARAVRAGGRLTGISLARELGAWTLDDTRLHVAIPPNASRLPLGARDIARHWSAPLESPDSNSSRDTFPNAIAIIAKTMAVTDAAVTIDSSLNLGLLDDLDWQRILRHLPGRAAALVRHVDGRSQSGLETRCRVSLRKAKVRLRIQVPIEGVGVVDVLVGDRLVIELDGRRFHDDPSAFENDRRRDLELARRGYRIIRLTYRQVMNEWVASEEVILRLVRAGEHLWRPSAAQFFVKSGTGHW